LYFHKIVPLFFLFSVVGKEVEEKRDIVWEDVGCTGVTRPALYPWGVKTEGAKRIDPADAVKRCSKNSLRVIQLLV
jgi:hypothetical protein